MSAIATQPELLGAAPPPVRRDPMVLVWLSAVGLSWFGDYAWNVALAWTAAHTLSPVMAGVVLGAEMPPPRPSWCCSAVSSPTAPTLDAC